MGKTEWVALKNCCAVIMSVTERIFDMLLFYKEQHVKKLKS